MVSIMQISRILHYARPACKPDKILSLLPRRGISLSSHPLLKQCVQCHLREEIYNVNSCAGHLFRTTLRKKLLFKIGNTFNPCGKRSFAKKGKLPFEVDIKVPKETLLYTHTNPKFFKMLSIFGVAQLIFWGQLALFSYTSLEIIDSNDGQSSINKDTFWGKILVMQTEYKSRIAVLCLAIGALVTFFTYIYPRRTIRQLSLLKGGRDLRVVTYSHFGLSRSFVAPVEHLSVEASRAGKASQVSLKIKQHRLFYLMDKHDGKFHDTNLFDYAVGLRRNIK